MDRDGPVRMVRHAGMLAAMSSIGRLTVHGPTHHGGRSAG
jgi:hypothetical protein